MDEQTLVIKMCTNGVVFKTTSLDDTGQPIIHREVIEQKDTYENETKREAEYAQRVAYWLLDWMELTGNKNDEYRVRVVIERRDGAIIESDAD